MEHTHKYDAAKNILTVTYIGHITTKEDIDFLVQKNTAALKAIGKKVWFIVNLSELKMSSPALIKYYAQANSNNMVNHTFAAFSYTTKTMQRVITHMYNMASGRKRVPFFKTYEETVEHIMKLQKEQV